MAQAEANQFRKIKVAGLVGSPRKGMNVDTLVDCVLNGCKNKGAEIQKVYLDDLEIKPCRACRVQDGNGCRFHDGMDVIKAVFADSDGIILGMPVYYSLMSSQVKLMIDRSYCFAKTVNLGADKIGYASCIQKRKKGLIFCVSHSGQSADGISGCIAGWANEINLEIEKEIYLVHNELGDEPRNKPDVLSKFTDYGACLYNSINNQEY